jgi:osmoprotectant transport system permease protein
MEAPEVIGHLFTFIGQMLDFIRDPQRNFADETRATLVLCIVPTLLAIAIGVVVGILVAPSKVGAVLATTTSGLARAIPTLVFLAAVLPYLGTGFRPSVVALVALGIPPILLNTVAGLRGVDPAAVDAARGMGMTSLQVLMRVRIPLVLPVVMAGIRTAAVQIVATTPLAAFIGAGGYGDYILAGINLLNSVQLYVGAVCIIILALATEFGLAAAQRAVTPEGVRGEQARQPVPEGARLDSALDESVAA